MKKIILGLITFIVVMLSGCGGGSSGSATTNVNNGGNVAVDGLPAIPQIPADS